MIEERNFGRLKGEFYHEKNLRNILAALLALTLILSAAAALAITSSPTGGGLG